MSEGAGLAGRIVLVTGASRGLGRATALAAAAAGARVIATARTQGALEELDDRIRDAGGEATLLPLDLLKGEDVDRLGPSIFQKFGRLDGLVHAAGELGPLTPAAQLDPKTLTRLFQLHAGAGHRLIRTLDPLLRKAEAGRALFVSDPVASEERAFFAGYAAAKQALEAIVLAYAAEVRKTQLRVNIVLPPPLRTRLRRDGWPGEADDANPPPDAAGAMLAGMLGAAETRHGMRIPLTA